MPKLSLSYILLFVSNLFAAPLDCINNPIKLAFYEYGYFYYDDGKGIDRDIVDDIAKLSGCKFQIEVMTRARIWAELKKGSLDMSVLGYRLQRGIDLHGLSVPSLSVKFYNYGLTS
ncbi:MAG: transporter substrate-binding domain-containing protein [Thermodesulfovibrionales bacterium]|nr:transporter substrate-binding domain-containing protein [Thermodesulfovibrionales bacterium]